MSFEKLLTSVGLTIKELRQKKGLTQIQLIELVHRVATYPSEERKLAQETLSRIENGRFNPTVRQIYFIATALDIDLQSFFNIVQKNIK